MNDFLFQEMLAEEYRRDQMTQAAQYNRFNTRRGKKLNLSIYRILSHMGEYIKSMGSRMQERYAYLARCEECKMQLNPAK